MFTTLCSLGIDSGLFFKQNIEIVLPDIKMMLFNSYVSVTYIVFIAYLSRYFGRIFTQLFSMQNQLLEP